VALYAATGVVLLHFVRRWLVPVRPTGIVTPSGEVR
jgi:hypothetical protein